MVRKLLPVITLFLAWPLIVTQYYPWFVTLAGVLVVLSLAFLLREHKNYPWHVIALIIFGSITVITVSLVLLIAALAYSLWAAIPLICLFIYAAYIGDRYLRKNRLWP